MRIQVLAFATAASEMGAGERQIELPDGATVAALRQALVLDHPGLGPLWERLAVAVEGELAGAETPLHDGAEVALLPPVSGGAGRRRGRLTEGPIDVAVLGAEVGHPSCGAVVLFLGNARDHHGGRPVTRLVYHGYRRMAEGRLGRICHELEAATSGLRLGIVHRLGEVPIGEASVAIAAAAPHRAGAFEAARAALERLKRETPIWKRETYADGSSVWREEEPLAETSGSSPSPAAGSTQPARA